MKTKVLALILAILCFSMSVVGCSTECTEHIDENKDAKCDKCEAEVACAEHVDEDKNLACDVCKADLTPACPKHVDENNDKQCDSCKAKLCDHKDENADNLCDACGGAIVAVNVQVPPVKEDRVEMVVGTVPNDVSLDSYVNTAPEADAEYAAEEVAYDYRVGYFAYSKETTENGLASTYTITNLLTGDVVYTKTVADTDAYNIYLADFYFYVVTSVGELETMVTTYEYYSYAGDRFYKDTVSLEDGYDACFEDYAYDNDQELAYYKLYIGDLVYIFAPETYELLFKDMDVKHFVDRPVFDVTNEDYGYIEMDDQLYVYDLSKWIDCVYAHDIPSYAEYFRWFVLEDGNVLLQWSVQLNDTAVTYDFLDYGDKYDMVTALIDLEEKKTEEVEFGYEISDVRNDGYPSVIKESTPNLAEVYPIINDRVDYSAKKLFAIDNDLTILYDFDQTLEISKHLVVASAEENLFLVQKMFGGRVVIEIVDEKGEHVNYLPEGAYYNGKWIEYDGKYYTLKMELILDPAKDGYYTEVEGTGFAIFGKYDEAAAKYEYFYFDGEGTPAKIGMNVAVAYNHELGFVLVVETLDEENNPTYECRLYNANNTLILVSDSNIDGYVNWVDTEATVGVLYDQTGNRYLVSAK